MLRVGIVGLGFGRNVHFPAWSSVPQTDVIGIATRDPHHSQSLNHHNIPIMPYDELLEAADLLSIAVQPSENVDLVTAALRVKKAVLSEKPLAVTADQAQHLAELAQAQGCPNAIDFGFRELPEWHFVRDSLQAGIIGKLRHITIHWIVNNWADTTRPYSWKVDRHLGGGTLQSFGSHLFDAIEWMIAPIHSLNALLNTSVPNRPETPHDAILAEDCCQLSMQLSNDVPVSVVISLVAWQSKNQQWLFHGEEGSLALQSVSTSPYSTRFEIWHTHFREEPKKLTVPKEYPPLITASSEQIVLFHSLAARFSQSIRENTPFEPSFKSGWRAQVLIDAAYQSEQTRTWVSTVPS